MTKTTRGRRCTAWSEHWRSIRRGYGGGASSPKTTWSTPDRDTLTSQLDRYGRGDSFPGWDLARIVYLARLGVGARWLTESESRARIADGWERFAPEVLDWECLADDIDCGTAEQFEDSDDLHEQIERSAAFRSWAERDVLPSCPWP